MIDFDENTAKRVEAMYQTPDVVGQRAAVLAMLAPAHGESVLDVGVGPGLLAFDLAQLVGESGHVAGIDLSEAMLAMTRNRCADSPQTDFRQADATALPFPDNSFDAAVSTQVYEYVADIKTALSELYRVLKPGGRAVILDTAWDSLVWNTTDTERAGRILTAWDEHLAHPNLPKILAPCLKEAGFAVARQDAFPMFNPAFTTHSYSAGIMMGIASFVAGRQGLTQEDVDAWLQDLMAIAESGNWFFSLNRYLFLAVKR